MDTGSPGLHFSQHEPPCKTPCILSDHLWLGSPNSVLIPHPCVHLRALLWFGPSLHSELHSLVLLHKPGHCWLHRIHGHGALYAPFHSSSFLSVSSCSLGTVGLSARVNQGFVVAGDDKGQTSGNALSWGACYPSVSVHRVLSQTRHPVIDCGCEGQLHMGQWHIRESTVKTNIFSKHAKLLENYF